VANECLCKDKCLHAGSFGQCKGLPSVLAAPVQETIAQTFTGLPLRKLKVLLTAGWAINGVSIERTVEDGTTRRGAVTTGGMVLWWHETEGQAVPETNFGDMAAPVRPVGVTTGCASHEGFFTVVFRSQQPIPDGTDLYTTPPAQPAPVQPVAWMHEWDDGERIPMIRKRDVDSSDIDSPKSVHPLVFGDTTPPAQPAVPEVCCGEYATCLKPCTPRGKFLTAQPAPCTWKKSNDPHMPDTFNATCGVVWTFTDGGPAENGVNFCPGCGAAVSVADPEPEEDLFDLAVKADNGGQP
jgi:hypothetical protein